MAETGSALIRKAEGISTASLHEAAGKIGALPHTLKPLTPEQRVCGFALPVASPPGDNLFLHHAIAAAEPGEVLVVDAGDGAAYGHWGEIMAAAAQARGVVGLVITGGVRDSQRMIEMGFPVFSESVSIRGTAKNPAGAGAVGPARRIGDVLIERGDLVVGDADGVVVLPKARATEIVALALRRDAEEQEILARLKNGETTLAIYNLPEPQADRPQPPDTRRRSIAVDGLSHGALPIPAASRVGGVIATGGVRGVERETGVMPTDVSAQARNMFRNLRAIVEAAGARCEDIVKVTIWVSAPEARAVVNEEWVAMFPNPSARPARHILNQQLPGGMLVQCEALAVAPRR